MVVFVLQTNGWSDGWTEVEEVFVPLAVLLDDDLGHPCRI